MKRFNKVALIPAAVAAVLAGNAYAGTEACFEVYKGADALAVTAFDTIYTGAACVAEASRTGAAADNLEATNEAGIAYELTGDLTVDFDAVDGTNTDQHIVYIPTTDIPGGTKITIALTGATFAGNSNQIHLVKDTDGAGAGTDFEAVASSDGTVDGASTITFLTKAGITIGAGTRLAFSRVSTGADSTAIDPVGIKIANTTCTSTSQASQSVTIAATSAVTDGGTGYNIQGAVSNAQKVADISPQFYPLYAGTTAEVQVNAESSNSEGTAIVARTQFVYNADATDRLIATSSQAIYKTGYYNRASLLDQAITLDADDHVETAFVASSEPGANVKMRLYNGRTAATGVLDTAVEVQTGTTPGAFGLTQGTATVYNTEAVTLFTESDGAGDVETNPQTAAPLLGADYNEMFYVVENNPTDGIMNFNYNVTTHYTLDFGTAGELDHCADNKVTHEVGVNGAVLKVPYVVNSEGNFVRITNEHDESAEVTVDVFSESADGNDGTRKVMAVELGSVPAKSSVVYFVPTLISEAVSQKQYEGADGGYGDLGSNGSFSPNRHSVTFTVTAPKNSVHGVSVQKVVGRSDRVMPVLDQNDWSQ
ncbi:MULTISPECIES: hypothetical protein [Pseudoalteromonas]|uniref:Uncharacterized protein n=1 Tax=Pseudoalteromonas amylolytica TaxID=1859457 RepID=A0A1S1MV83_9GAMM|nr:MULTISPECIES: hypothetical protein [Pseudoalteromonas]OHU90711.1 hypothetical protein BFC16_03660 [Pseudoalteromonas sp. JW3]OHU92670.1 hypothetical protein BET10_04230 [Pseudoalteromonas amylolytica]